MVREGILCRARALLLSPRCGCALYDQPAPDPAGPAFADAVRAVAALARCDPAVLAELLRAWTPAPGPSDA